MGKTKVAVIDASVDDQVQKKPRKKINPSPEEVELGKKVNPNPELQNNTQTKPKQQTDTKILKIQNQESTKQIRSQKYQSAQEKIGKNKQYLIEDAVNLVKETSYSQFDGTLEIHLNTSQKGVRGLVSLPYASGKKLRIIAFGKDASQSEADIIGDDDALNEIIKGKINFDVLVTTTEWMPKLARAAKVLGPKGLMPNPKNGTITNDLKKTVSELQGGKTEYKSESKADLVHLGLGKLSQPSEELMQNIKVLISTIGKSRIKKATLSGTMSPGIKLDLSSI